MKNTPRTTTAMYRESKLGSDTPFNITESYKALRTNILFSLSTSKTKIAIITSSLPNEGKSITCANLAIAMGQTGTKVLLIDADMRKPVQHKIFKVNNNNGLSRLLAGFDSLEKNIIKENVENNVDLITSGPIPPTPSELLGSQNMTVVLEKLSKFYGYIFIDTPPVNIVTDALVLSGESTGILLVTRQKQTTYDDLNKAIKSVKFAKANILGVVITDAKEQKSLYGGYKKYEYEYGYGSVNKNAGGNANSNGK